MAKDMSHISQFIESTRLRFTKCLDPTFTCEHDAIKAHSVQNAMALSLIEVDNHVYELKMRISNGNPVCEFGQIGRNNASTFPGFCAEHDQDLFRPIDTKALATTDKEQLFLIAYRSVSRELHACMEGAIRVHTAYQLAVATGRIPATDPSHGRAEATQHFLKAWSVWKYRYEHFDRGLTARQFGNVEHSIFRVEHEKPVLAASSFFSIDQKPWGKPFAAVTINVIPEDATKTSVIFSYPRDHSGQVRRYIAPVVLASAKRQKYELSVLLLSRAENFFISPRSVDKWTPEKRKCIEDFFISTLDRGQGPRQSPDLMLFD